MSGESAITPRTMRLRGRHYVQIRGFGLIDVTIAAAIMSVGAVVLITVLPQIIAAAYQRATASNAHVLLSAKIDEILSQPYSSVVNASGDYSTLLPDLTGVEAYSWEITVDEEEPLLRKKVTLVTSWGATSEMQDEYVFYVVNMNYD